MTKIRVLIYSFNFAFCLIEDCEKEKKKRFIRKCRIEVFWIFFVD